MLHKIYATNDTATVGIVDEVVMDWREFGLPDRLFIWGQMLAGETGSAHFTLETSEFGEVPDSSTAEFDATPGKQGSDLLQDDAHRTRFRLKARSTTGAPVNIIWGIVAILER